jgi:hypothetical protein
MTKMVQEQMLGQAQKRFAEIFTEVGANDPGMFFLDAGYILHDRFLQMCIPSVEYSRSDAPDSIRFAGGLPKGHRDPFTDQPAWWDEIVNNKTKKIVAVSDAHDSVFLSQRLLVLQMPRCLNSISTLSTARSPQTLASKSNN